MDLSDKSALAAALDALEREVGIVLPKETLETYLRGELQGAHLSDKLRGSTPGVHPLHRYMLACHAYLRQPNIDSYYDIYGASRAVPMVRILEEALRALQPTSRGLDARLTAIGAAQSIQEVDASFFEIICGGRYARELNAPVEFLEEASSQSPDLLCHIPGDLLAVETKKYDKYNDITREMREHVWNLVSPVIAYFSESGSSVLVDIELHHAPTNVNAQTLRESAIRSLRTGGTTVELTGVSVKVQRLPDFQRGDLLLFPSPLFLFNRYGYEVNSKWHGIIPMMRARWAGPSFVDDIAWDSAARWRITDQGILWRRRKLNYKLMFKGISQLQGWGDHRILHVAIERDPALGPRPEVLAGFLDALSKQSEARRVSWIVFNEIVAFPTITGHFDFQEHAHWVAGEHGESQPRVSTLFVSGETSSDDAGDWGIGATLPDL